MLKSSERIGFSGSVKTGAGVWMALVMFLRF